LYGGWPTASIAYEATAQVLVAVESHNWNDITVYLGPADPFTTETILVALLLTPFPFPRTFAKAACGGLFPSS
jgi:hypothetical protein